MGMRDKAADTGRCRVYVPAGKTDVFLALLKHTAAVTTSTTITGDVLRTMAAGGRVVIGNIPIRGSEASAPETNRPSGDTADNVLQFEVDPEDMATLENSGLVTPATEEHETGPARAAVFDIAAEDDASDMTASTPAPEPTGPFPWDKPARWRTPLLLAGGVTLGSLVTLGIVSALGQGIGVIHVAALIAFVLLVIGFERTMALVELLWQGRIADRDAAATAAEIARIDPGS